MKRLALALLLALVVGIGCKKEDPIYRVSGTIKWRGKDVPAGQIFFDPDESKGTSGRQGFAIIKDGTFDTKSEGRGVTGGHYIIRVLGFDGKVADDASSGKSLFPEYTEKRELPKSDSEQKIEVPGR